MNKKSSRKLNMASNIESDKSHETFTKSMIDSRTVCIDNFLENVFNGHGLDTEVAMLQEAKRLGLTDRVNKLMEEQEIRQEAMKEREELMKQAYINNMMTINHERLRTDDGDQSLMHGRAGTKMKYMWATKMDWNPRSPFSSVWMRCLAAGEYDRMMLCIESSNDVKQLLERRETLMNFSALFHVVVGALNTQKYVSFKESDRHSNGYLRCLCKLIELGANVDARDVCGFTPLFHCFVQDANPITTAMGKILLENGADPNAQNRIGEVALVLPVRYKHLECVKLLLDYGANPTIRDCGGCSVESTYPFDRDLKALFAIARNSRARAMRKEKKEEAGGLFKKCEVCEKSPKSLRRCTGCYMVLYCGKECQLSDWQEHKKKCTEMKKQFVSINLVAPDKNMVDICCKTGKVQYIGDATEPHRGNFVVKIQLLINDTSAQIWEKNMNNDSKRSLKNLTLYNQKKSIYGFIQEDDPSYDKIVRKIKAEGVYKEKGFFYAIVDKDKRLKINVENILPPSTW